MNKLKLVFGATDIW